MFGKPDEDVQRLAKAGTVAFGGVGIAGTTLPETASYFAIRERADAGQADAGQAGAGRAGAGRAELRPALERLLTTATPAGRVYAADLLSHLDPVAGQAAWRQLAAQPGEVSTFTGCLMGRTTLAEYARGRIDESG
jgi:hypothetical protein